jgi:hypothetical protein
MLALAQSREMQVSERTCRAAPGLGGREASLRALLRTSRIGNSRPSVAEAGLRAHHQTPRRARPARAWARPAGGHGSAKAFGRCFSEIGFRLDLAPERIVFGLGIKGPDPKRKPNSQTEPQEMASLRARSMAGPIPTPAELDEVFRGDHAGTLLAARAHVSKVRRSDARQARELSDRCVPPAGARGHAARARRVRRAHRRRGRLRQGARPSEPHARRASRHAQHRPRRSALA